MDRPRLKIYRQAGSLGSKPGFGRGASCSRAYARRTALPFSLLYHDYARWLFILLLFAGLLSSGWFGIPLVPRYFVGNVELVPALFTLFSALGTIWGVMAYREFTRSSAAVVEARLAARRLDPMVGDYEYKSYNPVTKEYEDGFVPAGPVDFWDKETTVPAWMDKGKYWHVLLSLQSPGREIRLQVVRDRDLPFGEGSRNVAVTEKDASEEGRALGRYTVKIPQWLVMNTEQQRFADIGLDRQELSALVSDVNMKIVVATNEVAGWERLRVRYPWRFMSFAIYLNKSLPLRIVYRQVIGNFPGARERKVEQTNANLAYEADDELAEAIVELAQRKRIPQARIEHLQVLMRFLKSAYTRQGLGEGASEYHNFHHSLEVSYLAMQMLPEKFHDFDFGPKDYELLLVAGLLHDYDPAQELGTVPGKPKGPSAPRTIIELQKTRVHDAYFTMSTAQFQEYFRWHGQPPAAPEDYATTRPEMVKSDWTPTESMIIEALIWRTDFPFFKQKAAVERYGALLEQLKDNGKVNLLAEVLWLADLSVTYMGSDPVRAWDRVNNLYDELYLPKLEAVSRTDAFFADFADLPLYRELMGQRGFPEVFRQRWNLIYQFFHEGNPSTPLNRTIETARKMYFRVNMELGMRRGEMLQHIASDNWSEYFIGVGRDQSEVLKAKSKLAELDPQNASAFWGDVQKLLPAMPDGSIDNFLIVMPEHAAPLGTHDEKASLQSMLAVLNKKLTKDGAVKILTDIGEKSPQLRELLAVAGRAGFVPGNMGKDYFPAGWTDPDFGVKPRVVTLVPGRAAANA
jgi:tRNA G46 methylase TrmB